MRGRLSVSIRDGVVREQDVDTRSTLTIPDVATCFGFTVAEGAALPCSSSGEIERFRADPRWRRDLFLRGVGSPGAVLAATEPRPLRDWLDLLRSSAIKPAIAKKMGQKLARTIHQSGVPANSDEWTAAAAGMLNAGFNDKAIAEALGRPPPPPMVTPYGELVKFSQYFEHLLVELAGRCFVRPSIVDAAANVKLSTLGKPLVAEHDVLVADRTGTLTSLDAKTFAETQKELDARLLNLNQASGRFARFIVVFPYFRSDLSEPWFNPVLRGLPFDLTRRGSPFAVFGEDERSFWVTRDGTGAVTAHDERPPDSDRVHCRSFEDLATEICA